MAASTPSRTAHPNAAPPTTNSNNKDKTSNEPNNLQGRQGEKNNNRSSAAGSAEPGQEYYADKDLSWWLQLARDFKSARKVPLPDAEDEGGI